MTFPALLALALAAADTYPPPGYPRGSLAVFKANTLREHPDFTRGDVPTLSTHPPEKLTIRVRSRGPVRALDGPRKAQLEAFAVNYWPEAPGLFVREILVAEGKLEQWVMFQETLWGFFQEEVRAGQSIELQVAFVGSVDDEFRFVANGFHASPRGELYEKACSLGEGLGCARLGDLHSFGVGVPPSVEQAERYWKKACSLGHKESCPAER